MALVRTGYANFAAFPPTGAVDIIYVDLSNGNEYTWVTSAYVAYTPTLVGVSLGDKSAAWFTANPGLLLAKGQVVFLDDQSGQFKKGDGVTSLSALSFLGSGVQSVSGTIVDNTDPLNPIVNVPTLQDVTDIGATTTTPITITQLQTNNANVTITDGLVEVLNDISSATLFQVDRVAGTITKNGVEIATVNDIPTTDTTIIDGSTNPVDGNAVFDGLATKLSKARAITFSHSALNPADSTTYYFGSNIVANSASTSSTALRRGYAPCTGFVYAGLINVQVSSTLGTTETATFTLNNITQGTSVVLSSSVIYSSSSNGFSFDLGSPFAINANDSLEIKIDMPTFATNPASVINLVTIYCGTK